jgi:hypothetical protein
VTYVSTMVQAYVTKLLVTVVTELVSDTLLLDPEYQRHLRFKYVKG